MCLLLAPLIIGFFSFFFLLRPLTVLMKQTRQAVCTIKQPIFLRCLWLPLTLMFSFAEVSKNSRPRESANCLPRSKEITLSSSCKKTWKLRHIYRCDFTIKCCGLWLQSQKNNWNILGLKMYFTDEASLQFNQPSQLNIPAAASLTFVESSSISWATSSAFFMAIF